MKSITFQIKNKGDDFGWAMIVDYKKEQMAKKDGGDLKTTELDSTVIVSVLMYISRSSAESKVYY